MLSKKHLELIWKHHKFHTMTYLTLPFRPQSSEQTIILIVHGRPKGYGHSNSKRIKPYEPASRWHPNPGNPVLTH